MGVMTIYRLGIALACCAFAAACSKEKSPSPAQVDSPYESIVSPNGDISFPTDFPMGMAFIGSWAVTGENGVADIHSVHARSADADYYRQHGEFPDGAVLIKEVVESKGASHTTGDAFWGEKTITWFLMVKDVKGRFPDHPLWGDGWGWAQFDPADRTRQIAVNYDESCKACHVPAAKTDRVYVYAYPALGPKAQQAAPPSARSGRAAVQQGHRNAGGDPGPADAPIESRIADGKKAFETQCSFCHSIESGKHGTGPSLFGVVGRKAGSAPGYDYSDAMRQAQVIWSRETIEKHLADTKGFIPGNRMGQLFGGVPDPELRSDIAAYLETVK